MTLKLVTFDLDDTLWDTKSVILNARDKTENWLRARNARAASAYADKELQKTAFEQVLREDPEIRRDLGRLRQESMNVIFQMAGIDTAEAESLAEEGFAYFYEMRQQCVPFTLAVVAIEKLRRDFPEVVLGTMTNGNADITNMQVGSLFDFHLNFYNTNGLAKPDKELFNLATTRASEFAGDSIGPNNSLHVGDDAELDVCASLRAGWEAIWYNPSLKDWPSEETGREIDSSIVMTKWPEFSHLLSKKSHTLGQQKSLRN